MKASLSFEFNLPEELDDYSIIAHSHDWKFIVSDTKTFLRNALKYGHQFKTPEEALEAVQTHIFELIRDYGIEES